MSDSDRIIRWETCSREQFDQAADPHWRVDAIYLADDGAILTARFTFLRGSSTETVRQRAMLLMRIDAAAGLRVAAEPTFRAACVARNGVPLDQPPRTGNVTFHHIEIHHDGAWVETLDFKTAG